MLYWVSHTTRYLYEEPVSQCMNELRLTPRSVPGQTVRESSIRVGPEPAVLHHRVDYFGNAVTSFAVFETHDRLITTAISLVEVDSESLQVSPPLTWEEARDFIAARAPVCLEAFEYLFDSPFVPTLSELADYARPTFTPNRPLMEAILELSHRIHTEFKYQPKSTSIDTPLLDVLRGRCGVCQDFSHLMIGVLRSLRIPARYVSGYLRSGAKFQGAEASHAWVAVFIPGLGWRTFDPTNDVMPSDSHITVAWGRDYGDVTPIKGVAIGGGKHEVEVEVQVKPAALT